MVYFSEKSVWLFGLVVHKKHLPVGWLFILKENVWWLNQKKIRRQICYIAFRYNHVEYRVLYWSWNKPQMTWKGQDIYLSFMYIMFMNLYFSLRVIQYVGKASQQRVSEIMSKKWKLLNCDTELYCHKKLSIKSFLSDHINSIPIQETLQGFSDL